MKKLLCFIILITLSFTSSAAITKLNCSFSDENGTWGTIWLTINSKNKTVQYGEYMRLENYQTEGDYIYWTNFTKPKTLIDPMFMTFFINLKTNNFVSISIIKTWRSATIATIV